MEDAVDVFHHTTDRFGVGDVAFDELDAINNVIEVRTMAGAEIVKHADPVSPLDESRGDMGSDKSGAAGYKECSHGFSFVGGGFRGVACIFWRH